MFFQTDVTLNHMFLQNIFIFPKVAEGKYISELAWLNITNQLDLYCMQKIELKRTSWAPVPCPDYSSQPFEGLSV